MSTFRRVEDARAGATAIGILVPPGMRTFVIVRPRALAWDLLPIDASASAKFLQLNRDEAAGLARRAQHGLQAAAEKREALAIDIRQADGGFQVSVGFAGVTWIACARVPGVAYSPCLFDGREAAQDAADKLLAYLRPQENAEQEYYFNTQNFAR